MGEGGGEAAVCWEFAVINSVIHTICKYRDKIYLCV